MQLQAVGLVNYPEIVVGDDMCELGWSSLEQFEQTDNLPLSLDTGGIMVSVQGMTPDGVYGRLARTFAKDSLVVSLYLDLERDVADLHSRRSRSIRSSIWPLITASPMSTDQWSSLQQGRPWLRALLPSSA